jgi:hypothetical protein
MPVNSDLTEAQVREFGSGPGGQRAATQAPSSVSGWSICEKHHEVGGVTIDTGSIPGKTPPVIRLEQPSSPRDRRHLAADADHNLQRGIEPCRD